jgi:hypothetical protein
MMRMGSCCAASAAPPAVGLSIVKDEDLLDKVALMASGYDA